MIENFESEYMSSYWNINLMQWFNYFENGNYDLSKADEDIFDIATKYNGLIKPIDRKSEIACFLIQKELIDKNPIISELRNRIDNFDNYNTTISQNLDKHSYLAELSLIMKDDVIALINIRDSLSKKLGFSSYPDLILKSEELEKNDLIKILNNYVEENLPKAKELIEFYNISWENWFSDLEKVSRLEDNLDCIETIKQFINEMGFVELTDKLQIKFTEKEVAGFASQVSPNDIRVVASPIKSLFDINVLFHELGHAISYYFNKEDGLYKVPSACYDEAMAVVIEYFAPKIIFDEGIQKKLADIQLLEYTRCAISSLFEFELWENPDNAESLYIKHYSKLGLKINNASVWSIDSFRSIDPVYIHNYVLGDIFAKDLHNYLLQKFNFNYRQWGKWLIDNIYYDGRKRSLMEKVNKTGGKNENTKG